MTTEQEFEELAMDRQVANKYGPQPAGQHYMDGENRFGVLTSRDRWPSQAKFSKGDKVVAHADANRHHCPAKREGATGTIVGFSRERANYGYYTAAGGNLYIVHWDADDSLTKMRPAELELEEAK